MSHPHGHSFAAVKALKETWDSEDKFLVYAVDEGHQEGFPFVVKSSRRKVKLMRNMDFEGDHRLREAVVHLDVIHSRTKGFKTYTLSYYDIPLQMLIKLCTMDTTSECKQTCAFFFKTINVMIQDLIEEEDPSNDQPRMFNPYHLKDDENGGNKQAMAEIFGRKFVEERTSSCEFHFAENAKRHAKYVQTEPDRKEYYSLTKDMKDSTTEKEYEQSKRLLEILIARQSPENSKKL